MVANFPQCGCTLSQIVMIAFSKRCYSKDMFTSITGRAREVFYLIESAKLQFTVACFSLCSEKHFAQAVEGYTRAIELNPNVAIYYGNRAFAHIRLENYGSALEDATKATEINPKYIKVCTKNFDV